jgi:hypothetical protein
MTAMAIDRITLQDLLEKGSDAELLRAMIGLVAERLMALEVEGVCGACSCEARPDDGCLHAATRVAAAGVSTAPPGCPGSRCRRRS